MAAARPKSIIRFERLYLGSLAIVLVIVAAAWSARPGIIPLDLLIPAFVGGVLLPGTLTLLVSRRRSNLAKWALVVVFATSLAANLANYRPGELRLSIVALVMFGLQIGAIALLFTRPSRDWLAGKDPSLTRTFE